MVFQQNLLEKAFFIAKMSGPAGQFRLLESALAMSIDGEIARCDEVVFTPLKWISFWFTRVNSKKLLTLQLWYRIVDKVQ